MTLDPAEEAWLRARLASTEAMIIAMESAIIAISGGAQSYTLDTGQTRSTVTKSDLASLRLQLKALDDRRTSIRNQLGLGNTVGHQTTVLPDF